MNNILKHLFPVVAAYLIFAFVMWDIFPLNPDKNPVVIRAIFLIFAFLCWWIVNGLIVIE